MIDNVLNVECFVADPKFDLGKNLGLNCVCHDTSLVSEFLVLREIVVSI